MNLKIKRPLVLCESCDGKDRTKDEYGGGPIKTQYPVDCPKCLKIFKLPNPMKKTTTTKGLSNHGNL